MKGGAIEIIPTCVPRSAEELADRAREISAFSPVVHIDIVDGIFASSHTWPYTAHGTFGKFDLAGLSGLTAEIHLMVEEPREIGVAFAQAGAKLVMGHAEVFSTLQQGFDTLDTWRKAGASSVGLGLLLATPLEVIEPFIPACDVVHVMSIATIGAQGIPYDDSAPARIAEFHARFPDVLISVDGGVSEKNIEELVRAGARRFGVGAAIVRAPDPADAYKRLTSLAFGALSQAPAPGIISTSE